MNRLSLSAHPLLLGFDQVDRLLEQIGRQAGDNYPPFNIEQIGDDRLRISLAVAGFAPEDLTVQVEQNQLVVQGRRPEPAERVYLHRGIAGRQFRRSFVLAEGLEVTGARLDQGILAIDLERPLTVENVRTITIRAGDDVVQSPAGNGRTS